MKYKLSKMHPGKRVFITGGGSGLGRALSVALAKDAWTIGITDINEEGLKETARLIMQAGGKSFSYVYDVSNKVDYKKAFDKFILKAGGLDILINNAGVGESGFFGEYDLDNWDWITGVNLMATVYGSHFATPVFKKQGSGHIISVASAAGFVNLPNMSMYNATKAAVISLMETLHVELYGYGINVSVVCPTVFKSNIMQHSKGDAVTGSEAKMISQNSKYTAEDMADSILKSAGEKTFCILPTHQPKLVYHIKRLFPDFFLDYKTKQYSEKNGLEWVKKILEF